MGNPNKDIKLPQGGTVRWPGEDDNGGMLVVVIEEGNLTEEGNGDGGDKRVDRALVPVAIGLQEITIVDPNDFRRFLESLGLE